MHQLAGSYMIFVEAKDTSDRFRFGTIPEYPHLRHHAMLEAHHALVLGPLETAIGSAMAPELRS